MNTPFLFLLMLALIPFFPFSSSTRYTTLTLGSSLSAPEDVLVSLPTAIFTAGFYPVGDNAYFFAIWFTEPLIDGNVTIVWMANRDQPVNGRNTKLSLSHSGNLVLTDAGQLVVWTTNADSAHLVQLQLHDNGNLVLQNTIDDVVIWQSFDSPTNTLLPQQPLTRNVRLVSPRSQTNYSTGFYKFFFDNDNVLRLVYNGAEMTSVFWPPPWLNSWDAGRTTYNDSKIASLDLVGNFLSSDDFQFNTTDFGFGPQRRLSIDPDGNARVYSLDKAEKIWKVTWQLTPEPCKTHGICGLNGLCLYTPGAGPTCSCLPGYKMKNSMDWSEGCVPEFEISCNDIDSVHFLKISHVEFYGYDIKYYPNYTLDECKNLCLSYCNCKGFQFKLEPEQGFYSCFPKMMLFNGYQSIGFGYWMHIRLPKSKQLVNSIQEVNVQCSGRVTQLDRAYNKTHERSWLKSLLWCTGAVGAFEIMFLLIFLYKTRQRSGGSLQQYLQVATGFKRFTYGELKTASRNFCEEIGHGGSGVVYKGKLSDNRVAAIKRLNEANQGEAEFLAEVSLIGRLNHANLIEPWGYCAEGKHRLLVYEYLEHGSLTENLNSDKLDWSKRFDIALGTAKGLAYLHEEYLEWVLHCDVKPENILLDSTYQPKVADFGLSKLLNRGSMERSNFSTIRGTRGYMAPEWVFHLPITSKVDVYSYGIVMLEMVTGRSPKGLNNGDASNGGIEHKRLVSWVREIMNGTNEEGSSSSSWIEQIVDPGILEGEYDVVRMENLVRVALQCAHENKDARPTMRQVTDMLLGYETNTS
ncbi:hypothetical protein BUALT_Bualt08G0037200 [Buddleja alternifolia]|uniref:Receptor-like serine/threonine-protein kinase n=1 Tax=Buddleja alternifolia TaxID=168488 RepID=A0AAV6XBF1_9LAMI|nr:hypothetical protein BUALT_Bualt08G0037200 [Buddleja alternifolia]